MSKSNNTARMYRPVNECRCGCQLGKHRLIDGELQCSKRHNPKCVKYKRTTEYREYDMGKQKRKVKAKTAKVTKKSAAKKKSAAQYAPLLTQVTKDGVVFCPYDCKTDDGKSTVRKAGMTPVGDKRQRFQCGKCSKYFAPKAEE